MCPFLIVAISLFTKFTKSFWVIVKPCNLPTVFNLIIQKKRLQSSQNSNNNSPTKKPNFNANNNVPCYYSLLYGSTKTTKNILLTNYLWYIQLDNYYNRNYERWIIIGYYIITFNLTINRTVIITFTFISTNFY